MAAMDVYFLFGFRIFVFDCFCRANAMICFPLTLRIADTFYGVLGRRSFSAYYFTAPLHFNAKQNRNECNKNSFFSFRHTPDQATHSVFFGKLKTMENFSSRAQRCKIKSSKDELRIEKIHLVHLMELLSLLLKAQGIVISEAFGFHFGSLGSRFLAAPT